MQPKIFLADEHDIDSTQLDPDAFRVIQRLQEAGFAAFLVGGGVRDLLVKKKPKDFDISTSAKPEEIKQLFRKQCLLIGRRFRLAHIRFGRKIIEVSTFRSGDSAEDLIVRDNVWGTPEEDAMRRDFTINGLFYDPTEHHVIDYVGGWEDIHTGTLKTIGNPIVRFKQDPVRMIRLLKFQARFNFTVTEELKCALKQCLEEIAKSSPARVLEEIFRMLESGSAAPFFKLMHTSGFLDLLLPWLSHFLEDIHADSVYQLLAAADRYHSSVQHTLDRAVLSTCLEYPILEQEIYTQYLRRNYMPHLGEISSLTSTLGRAIASSSFSHFPKRLRMLTHSIITMQYRMTPLTDRVPHRKIAHHPDFPLALQFLHLRSMVDQNIEPFYQKWRDVESEKEEETKYSYSGTRKRGFYTAR